MYVEIVRCGAEQSKSPVRVTVSVQLSRTAYPDSFVVWQHAVERVLYEAVGGGLFKDVASVVASDEVPVCQYPEVARAVCADLIYMTAAGKLSRIAPQGVSVEAVQSRRSADPNVSVLLFVDTVDG